MSRTGQDISRMTHAMTPSPIMLHTLTEAMTSSAQPLDKKESRHIISQSNIKSERILP